MREKVLVRAHITVGGRELTIRVLHQILVHRVAIDEVPALVLGDVGFESLNLKLHVGPLVRPLLHIYPDSLFEHGQLFYHYIDLLSDLVADFGTHSLN